MGDYAYQAEVEMWDAVASQDRWAAMDEERRHWEAVRDGLETPRRDLYRPVAARFAGRCDGCTVRVRKGQPILYTSNAPYGFKVYHEGCFPSV